MGLPDSFFYRIKLQQTYKMHLILRLGIDRNKESYKFKKPSRICKTEKNEEIRIFHFNDKI